ncbi:MAG: Asp23/Gls24 family envelope stress response protein [bacterium]
MNEEHEAPGAEIGRIEIADEVIRSLAGSAVIEVEGVVGMRGGIIEGLKEATTGKRDFSKGVEIKKVPGDEPAYEIDVHVVVDSGVQIGEVGKKVQKSVKERVEGRTGNRVNAVNVHVVDVRFKGAGPAASERQ